MDYGIRGRVIVVTGGGSGIGRGTSLLAAAQGAIVGVADANAEATEKVAAEIAAAGGTAMALAFDVVDEQATEAALDRLEAAHGPISGLVACAGISRPQPVEQMTDEIWNLVIGVNLTGLFQSCQSVGRRIIRAGKGGAIVTIGSTDSLGGHSGRAHYCASKHGVVGVTKVLALEWGHMGVRVNCIAPGAVDTPLLRNGVPGDHIDLVLQDRTPMNKLGNGDDLGRAALFLLSDAASYVNGVVLPVDGGVTSGYMARWNGRDLSSNALLEKGVYQLRNRG